MKKNLLIVLFFAVLYFQSCSIRNDKVFSASDELHYIILYEKEKGFELLYNGINKAKGSYSLVGDTIMLEYSENQLKKPNPYEKLTRRILIDTELNRVKSLDDGMQFCADIKLDKRNKN